MTHGSIARWLVGLGALGMILGAALPWLAFELGPTRVTVTAMGITLEGALIIAAGTALAAIAVSAPERPGDVFSMPAIAVASLAGLVGLMALGRVSMEIELTRSWLYLGLPLALVSTAVAFAGGCWPIPRRSSRAAPNRASPVEPLPLPSPAAGSAGPGSAGLTTTVAGGWTSVLEHDVVRFCQVMWPQPDAARWKYGGRRFAETADYLARNGLLMRDGAGYVWRYRQPQVMRWVGTARIDA